MIDWRRVNKTNKTIKKQNEMETIKYKRAYLSACALIAVAGKYSLQVSNDVTDKNLVANEDGSAPRYIVGLKAIAEDKYAQVREVFKDSEEVEIDQTNGLFMTANIWKTGNEVLPVKNEIVDCIVDYVPNKESGEMVLRIVSIKVRKATVADKLDVIKFFTEVETPTVESSSTTLQHS